MNMMPFPSSLFGQRATMVRDTSSVYVNNSGEGHLPLPSAAEEGDFMIIYTAHSFGAAIVEDWTLETTSTGSNWNGTVQSKILDAGDIILGEVPVDFTDAHYGVIMGVVFIGPTGGIRDFATERNSDAAATRDVNTNTDPEIGDVVVSFGSARVEAAVTSDTGSMREQITELNASGTLNILEPLTVAGTVEAVLSYSGTQMGDYSGVIVVAPAP